MLPARGTTTGTGRGTMREAYRRGQVKVGTTDIQALRCNLAAELLRIVKKRLAKGRTTDDPGIGSLRVFRAEAKPATTVSASDEDVDGSLHALLAQLRSGVG